jgi:HSP20 family protein
MKVPDNESQPIPPTQHLCGSALKKSDLEVQVKGSTIRLAGAKSIDYGENVSQHRRERLRGRFDRSLTLPVEIDADGIRAECRDGILALFLPSSEREKAKTITVA